MKRLSIPILAMALALTLAGCLDSTNTKAESMRINSDDSLLDIPSIDGTESLQEGILTVELVEQALKEQQVKLGSKHRSTDWVLNGVQAMMYTISDNLENKDDLPSERISVYIYRSGEERKDGLNDFKLQAEKYNMQMPNIYEQYNVLLLYWHKETLDKASSAQYAQEIRYALDQLSHIKIREVIDPGGALSEAENTKRNESHGAATMYIKRKYPEIYGGTYTSIEGEKFVLLTEITPELENEIHARTRYPITLKKVQYTEQQLEEAKHQLSAFTKQLELQGMGLDVEQNRVVVNSISATAPIQAEKLLGDLAPSIFLWNINEQKAVYEPLN